MPTHYEALNVPPTASESEIEAAWDEKYNTWRRLVNHHEDQVRLEAERALQTLQKIRETLLDPARRAAYDDGLNLNGRTAGLADPTAILQSLGSFGTATSPPPPPAAAQSTAARPTSTLWACPKCGTENAPNTKFCLNCATQLVRTCPECRKDTSLVATGVCGECGFSFEAATRRAEIRERLAQLEKQEQELRTEYDAAARTWISTVLLGLGWILIVYGALCAMGGLVGLLVGSIGGLLAGLLAGAFWFAVGYFILKRQYAHKRQHLGAESIAVTRDQVGTQIRELSAELDASAARRGPGG